MIAGVLFLEIFILFLGLLLWFFTTQKGSAVVVTNLSSVFDKLIQEIPPLPNIDTFMWLRIGAFLALAVAVEGNEDVLKEFWDELLIWVWRLGGGFWANRCIFFRSDNPAVQLVRHPSGAANDRDVPPYLQNAN